MIWCEDLSFARLKILDLRIKAFLLKLCRVRSGVFPFQCYSRLIFVDLIAKIHSIPGYQVKVTSALFPTL